MTETQSEFEGDFTDDQIYNLIQRVHRNGGPLLESIVLETLSDEQYEAYVNRLIEDEAQRTISQTDSQFEHDPFKAN